MNFPLRRQAEIVDLVASSRRGAGHSSLTASELSSELSSIEPSTGVQEVDVAGPPMAPGIGGFNIDPPATSTIANRLQDRTSSGPIFSLSEILAATDSRTLELQKSSMALMVQRAFALQTLNSAPRTSPIEDAFPRDGLPSVMPAVSPCAPGVDGFNVALASRASPIADAAAATGEFGLAELRLTRELPVEAGVARRNQRRRRLLALRTQLPSRWLESRWLGTLSFIFSLVTIIGLLTALLVIPGKLGTDVSAAHETPQLQEHTGFFGLQIQATGLSAPRPGGLVK